MLTVYTKPSQITLKVEILLEETGLEYQAIDIQTLRKGTPEHDAFLKVNPAAQVPTLIDPETEAVVFESAAIMIYLAEKTGQFLPGPEQPRQRAETLKWVMFEASSLGPAMLDSYHYTLKAPENVPYSEARAQARIQDALSILEGALGNEGGRDYIAHAYSIADIVLYPWMSILEMADVSLDAYPRLHAWTKRLDERPAIKACA